MSEWNLTWLVWKYPTPNGPKCAQFAWRVRSVCANVITRSMTSCLYMLPCDGHILVLTSARIVDMKKYSLAPLTTSRSRASRHIKTASTSDISVSGNPTSVRVKLAGDPINASQKEAEWNVRWVYGHIPPAASPAPAWSNWQTEQNACIVQSPVLHSDRGRAVSCNRRCVESSMVATSIRVRAEGMNSGSRDASIAKGVWSDSKQCPILVSNSAFSRMTLC